MTYAQRQAPPDISWAGASALAFVILYTLPLAGGAGYVFYASIHPARIPVGDFSPVINLPWSAESLLIAAAWLLGPVPLLVAGLLHLIRDARRKWWSAAAWVGALAAGTVLGYVIANEYALLFSAYPRDVDGSPLGCCSRWAPVTPYWQALFAAAGQLAVGAVMTLLIIKAMRNRIGAAEKPAAEPPAGIIH